MKKVLIVLALSIGINMAFGYLFFKAFVYQAGYQVGFVNGQQVITQQVKQLIAEKKLIVPISETK